MNKRIVNLEINEIPPVVLKDFINKNKSSFLGKLHSQGKLKIFKTFAGDILKKKLYPSQTWASFNLGTPYSKHKCYWYSDPLEKDQLIWNRLASNSVKVGVLGSLHSSKYPDNFLENPNYSFYLPDCFTDNCDTKPKRFNSFQSLNSRLVSGSARVTNLFSLIKEILKLLFPLLKNPSNFGISFFSLKQIIRIIFWTIKSKNKEFLRMSQFPMLASIFLNLLEKYSPDYSTLFSNHLAGNMHRYWYAYKPNDFINKSRYPKKWMKNNKDTFYLSLKILDEFIFKMMQSESAKNLTILITSSMGQEANPKFEKYKLSNFDGKIKRMDLFMNYFRKFNKNSNDMVLSNELISRIKYVRNMAPQYGFEIDFGDKKEVFKFGEKLRLFIQDIGFDSKIDYVENLVTLTLDPAGDVNFQENYTLRKAQQKFNKMGFYFSKINDHHSGAHCEEGTLAIINGNNKIKKILKNNININGYINYLNYHAIILEYFGIKSY